MKIYQIIYTSTAVTITGSSGFGVRTVSEGTPKEYIDLVNKSIRKYESGKFTIHANDISKSPERIFEYPISYYYKVLPVNERSVHVVGRIVNTCFDHSFYVTGKTTRPGNYLAHILVSEEFPGKEIFNLLSDEFKSEDLYFIPKDWTPVQTNQELVDLMVGKPQAQLPVLKMDLPEMPLSWDAKSLDLLFSYRLALKEQKPIVVSLKEEITSFTVAKFMNLLPGALVKDATFVLNHQDKGNSNDVKITFVNEYYQYTIYQNLVTHINLFENSRQVDNVESIWRPMLEQTLKAKDKVKCGKLINWIFSDMADDNVELPTALNEALFNYSQDQSLFTLNTVDEVNNILQTISKYINKGSINEEHLNNLIINGFKDASKLEDFEEGISYCEKLKNANISISSAKAYIQKTLTDYIIADANIMFDAFNLFKEKTLREYSIAEKYPKFSSILPEILAKQTDIVKIIEFAKYLEKDANIRVENYLTLLNKYPEAVKNYTLLLNSDKFEAEKLDYIGALKQHLSNVAFAEFFYQQIKRESNTRASIELSKKIKELADVNEEFKNKIKVDDKVYYSIYSSVKSLLRKDNYEKINAEIEANILTLLADENSSKREWLLLSNVLNLKLEEGKSVLPFYELAKGIRHTEALKLVAPQCFKELPKEQIEEFLTIIYELMIMSDEEIINYALTKESRHHLSYIIPVAKTHNYDYDKIYDLVMKCVADEKQAKKIIKANFKKLYSKHSREVFFAKIKSLFTKKKKEDKEVTENK